MNYIKPEDIKEYVSKNPEGIAGMSEELVVMVNHFAQLIVQECIAEIQFERSNPYRNMEDIHEYGIIACDESIRRIKQHFGVEQ